jgi:hypothetical protein
LTSRHLGILCRLVRFKNGLFPKARRLTNDRLHEAAEQEGQNQIR